MYSVCSFCLLHICILLKILTDYIFLSILIIGFNNITEKHVKCSPSIGVLLP